MTIETWERVHRASVQAGDHLAAAGAAVRVAMHLLFDTALLAPVRAWLTRAERLLKGSSGRYARPCVARRRTQLRTTAFRRFRERTTMGPASHRGGYGPRPGCGGHRTGRGGTQPHPAGRCDARARAAQRSGGGGGRRRAQSPLDRTGVLRGGLCASRRSGGLHRPRRGVDKGDGALAARTAGWKPPRAMPCPPCGNSPAAWVLRRRGDADSHGVRRTASLLATGVRLAVDGARSHSIPEGRYPGRGGCIPGGPRGRDRNPQPGLALVHLARGDVARAARSIHEALDRPSTIPSKEWPPNTELRRAPLLEAQVGIGIAAGNLGRARSAAEELSLVAARFQSKAFEAGATLAHGRVHLAEGDTAGARRDFETAAQQWGDIGAPYETAVARMGLAHALRAEGKEERAVLEFQRPAQHSSELERPIRNLARRRSAVQRCPPDRPNGAHHLMRISPIRQCFVANVTTGWSGSGTKPHACAIRRVCSTWRVSSPIPGESFTCWTSWLPAKPCSTRPVTPVHPAWCPMREMPASCSMVAQKRRIADGSQRSTRTLRKRGRWRMFQRGARPDAEREFLLRELARAVSFRGRNRRAGSASERARSAVTRAVRQGLSRIREQNASLGEHLDRTIRTGTYCAYLPDSRVPVGWKL